MDGQHGIIAEAPHEEREERGKRIVEQKVMYNFSTYVIYYILTIMSDLGMRDYRYLLTVSTEAHTSLVA